MENYFKPAETKLLFFEQNSWLKGFKFNSSIFKGCKEIGEDSMMLPSMPALVGNDKNSCGKKNDFEKRGNDKSETKRENDNEAIVVIEVPTDVNNSEDENSNVKVSLV